MSLNKRIVFLLSAMMISTAMFGQKKVIAEAKQYVKTGKSLNVAENLMTDLLADSLTVKMKMEVYAILFESLRRQYENENEKIYLRQPYDTVAFFGINKKIITVAEDIDNYERKFLKDNKIHNNHSKSIASLSANILSGAFYFAKHNDYLKGYDYSSFFIEMADKEVFRRQLATDSLIYKAASLAVYCGHKLSDYEKVMRYAQLALNDQSQEPYIYQYMAEAYKMTGDTIHYVEILNSGFNRFPTFSFFFPKLIEHYFDRHDYNRAANIVDKALSVDRDNILYQFTKSTLFLNMGKYDECIDICLSIIEQNDSLKDVYYNIGAAYFNKAIELNKGQRYTRKQQMKINDLYRQALPYMEHYRYISPDKREKWLSILYTIYLNLNMGKEFDEINKIANRM